MNVAVLAYVVLVISTALSLVLLVWLSFGSYLKWSAANQRAGELLCSVLTRAQYCQLIKRGFVDIPSPRDHKRIYRVPRAPLLVAVIEQGRRKENLCLQPLEWVPDADVVVMRTLMIEADEETYLQTANRIAL